MRSDEVKRGLRRAPHRALLKALGLDDERIGRPWIGIASSYSEVVPGHLHLRELVEQVKLGVEAAGGVGFEFNTIAICDGIAMGHAGMCASLPSREVVADSVELMVRAHGFDGLVLVAGCDKIVPGMLMAAARVDIPAVMLTAGPMLPGWFEGGVVDLISVFEGVGKVRSGQESEQWLGELEEAACPGVGSCAGMFTANTMACIAEALGMALPGGATAAAVSARRRRIAYMSGVAAVRAALQGLRPSRVMTRAAFENAAMVDLALGGSTNTALHLPAIAVEAGVEFTLEDMDALSRTTPHLCDMSPAGPMRMVHLDLAGGVGAVMKALGGRIHGDAMSVLGVEIASYMPEAVPEVRFFDQPVIHPADEPLHPEGGIAVLKGSLAPEGAVVKQTAVAPGLERFSGPARVFDREEAAVEAVAQGAVQPGEVIVVRYEGPAGGPGMREMLQLTAMISGGPLDGKVALVTDGRFSGGSRGVVVGHACPEAARGGVLGLVVDGDPIVIDIPARRIELEVDEAELARRRAGWKPPVMEETGVLLRYSRMVGPASRGAVLEGARRS